MLVNIDPNEILVQPEHAEALLATGENGYDKMEVLDELEGYFTGAVCRLSIGSDASMY